MKGKLRERLAEHRESAFLSRQVGRIVTDLPVALDLESARTGRYDRRAVAQRFRELEFRSLIDRLPPSSIAPTGHDAPEQETKGGLQLSLDLLGGERRQRPMAQRRPAARAAGRDRGSGGAIERVEPRIPRSEADQVELEAWLAAQGAAVGLGWAATVGRPLERQLLGIALAGADGKRWYVPWSNEVGGLQRWLARGDRPLVGHDLKQLIVMLASLGVELKRHLLRHPGGRLHGEPALRPDPRRPGRQPIRRRAAGEAAPGGDRSG